MGTFDHLEWIYNGAFEQLFGPVRGEFEQKFSKNSNARGFAPGRGGMLKLRFDWYIMYRSNCSFNIPPPQGIPWAFDVFCCPGGREFDELSLPRGGAFDHYSQGVWEFDR